MTKTDLIFELAAQADLPKAHVERVLLSLATITARVLSDGDEVVLPGIGKLIVTNRAARTGRNPATGATIDIAASKSVKLRTASTLKNAVA